MPPHQDIQFLTIDVEGFDTAVLRGSDWSRFRPKCVLVEIQDIDFLMAPNENETCRLMRDYGYRLFAKTYFTAVYMADP
jgi:hypothetical protein